MKQFVTLGALWCLLGAVAGSLGAHGLNALITKMGGANNFSLATHYMFYHGLGLIAVGLLKDRYPDTPFQYAGWLFVAGSILFQGNLYLISIAGIRVLQVLTPVGGICLLAGWLTLVVLAARFKSERSSR
jgi:uncharacterized membrane protein YgdD (TMEM256/DUF423 family)